MKDKIKMLLYFGTLFLFIIILTLTTISFYFLGSSQIPKFLFLFVKYHVLFMFLMAFFGLVFGFVSNIQLNKAQEKNKSQLKEINKAMFKLLSSTDKKILEFLGKNNGVSTQYELTKIEGLTKLKVHRSLENLELKKIVSKQRIGKINKIYLSEEFLILFK